MIDFSDLEGDLNEGGPARPKAGGQEWTNPCAKCRGTGRFTSWAGRDVGPCNMCKGTGKLTFRTSPETRQKASNQRAERKARDMAAGVEAFIAAYPAEHAWATAASKRGFEFATSLLGSVLQFGHLTDNQMAALRKCMARDAEKTATRAATTQTAKTLDVSRIADLFATARGNALKRPTLRIENLELSLASERGKNPGAIYVKRTDDTYLGKIVDGVLMPSFAATSADIEAVKATAADPLGLAVAYGRRTGNCACCGRTLSDPESVERGIGPICLNKWGM